MDRSTDVGFTPVVNDGILAVKKIDGNKRTALNSTELLYDLNGYDFDYDDIIRGILQVFAINAEAVDMDAVTTYCRTHTSPMDTYS